MKNKLLLIFLFLSFGTYAQTLEETLVKETIDDFFKAFHSKDSLAMQQVVSSTIYLQTVGRDKAGEFLLRTENYADLVRSITSIPDSVSFQERLTDYTIQIDEHMANAWVPYEFWLNGAFHHCGVNSFQLFKENDAWQIIYLIDTRRTEGCTPSSK